MLRRNRPEMIEDSGVLEPLVEFQADQPRVSEETVVVSQTPVDSKSDDVSGMADYKEEQLNEELANFFPISRTCFPSSDQAEEHVNPEDTVKDVLLDTPTVLR